MLLCRYDFILDTNFKVWLLEVNCSPTFEHSTPITSRLIKQLSEDIIRVTVDVPSSRAGAPSSPVPPLSKCSQAPATTSKDACPELQEQASAKVPAAPELTAGANPRPDTDVQCITEPASNVLRASILDEPLNGRSGTNATAAYIRSLDGIDTGGFECIFRDVMRAPGGPLWPSFGAAASDCLPLQCTALKLPPKLAAARPTLGSKAALAAAAPPSATAAAAVARSKSSRSPSPTRSPVAVYDQQHSDAAAAAAAGGGSPPSLTLCAPFVVSAIATAIAAAEVGSKDSHRGPLNGATAVSLVGKLLCSGMRKEESPPIDMHPSQHPQPSLDIRNSSRPQTPRSAVVPGQASRDVSGATEQSSAHHAAAGATSTDVPQGTEATGGNRKHGAETHDSHVFASADERNKAEQKEGFVDKALQSPSDDEVQQRARRRHQAAGDAAVPDILQSIDNAVAEGESLRSLLNAMHIVSNRKIWSVFIFNVIAPTQS